MDTDPIGVAPYRSIMTKKYFIQHRKTSFPLKHTFKLLVYLVIGLYM